MSKKKNPASLVSEETIHQRWIRKRKEAGDFASASGRPDQCLSCEHYVPLKGDLGRDWGACSNAKSPFDGRLVFEHERCDQFQWN